MELGRVIGGHYLLQRLIKQGQYATVYMGIDQAFQRIVAVKAVAAAQVQVYRAAVRRTAQFTFPNMVGLYDLVVEQDRLYLIQEYIDGEDFAALLQSSPQPHEVADYGHQICLTLMYAASSSRRTCHGDLTPSAIMRDRRGLIRVNNFALPGDENYFSDWSVVGGGEDKGNPFSDSNLPLGVESQGRRADDTRAVGLLLYQLLAGRAQSSGTVEPPADGRLRFRSNIPPELCDVVARTVIRNHPQYIDSVEVLNDELKILREALEPADPVVTSPEFQAAQPVQSAMVPPVAQPEVSKPRQFAPTATGKYSNPISTSYPVLGHSAYQQAKSEKPVATVMETADSSAPTIADPAIMSAIARPINPVKPYPHTEATPQMRRSSIILLLLLGLLIFVICFAIGVYGGTFLMPH
ncbi:MAG TPA: protein kinase [Ktedonobacteraceae bacterium]|nr:protein kinase [Ktedonobacteraceae bacterium]